MHTIVKSFKNILVLFSTLRYFYDKLPEKGKSVDLQGFAEYLEKLKHYHGIGPHCYYVADLLITKVNEKTRSKFSLFVTILL